LEVDVRIRIIKRPRGSIDGVSIGFYRIGESYDVTAMLGQYLMAEGFAQLEMRVGQRSRRPRPSERRKSNSPFFSQTRQTKKGGPTSEVA
jgi:hypothetical protein